jgi:hypothetical protein
VDPHTPFYVNFTCVQHPLFVKSADCEELVWGRLGRLWEKYRLLFVDVVEVRFDETLVVTSKSKLKW